MKDIDGDGFGAVVESEEKSRVGTEELCGFKGSCCGGLKGSLCGGLNIDVKSHMQIILDTIIDVRRMYESMYIYKSSHTLSRSVVDQLCRPLDNLYRSAEPVVTHKHKRVRFNDNDNNNHDNGNGDGNRRCRSSGVVRRPCCCLGCLKVEDLKVESL